MDFDKKYDLPKIAISTITNFIQLISPQPVDQFFKPSYTKKPQMRVIYIDVEYTKVITDY